MDREHGRRNRGLLLSIPALIVLIYLASFFYNRERVVPRGVTTVQDFYRRYGDPPHIRQIVINGRDFYEITGEIAAPLAFPRGNPQYIFDGQGRLLDWTAESAADPDFTARWKATAVHELAVVEFFEKFPPN